MVDALIALVALSGLGVAAITLVRQRVWRDMLRDTQRRLYLAQTRLTEVENTLQRELRTLRTTLRQVSGTPLIDATMKIADAIAIEPKVREVLAQFHLGGCSACGINEEQSIEQAALGYGVDLERLMAALSAVSLGQEPVSQDLSRGGLLQLTEL